MKLLIDENLSRKLVARLSDLFPGSIHVTDVALIQSPDAAVWEYQTPEKLIVGQALFGVGQVTAER